MLGCFCRHVGRSVALACGAWRLTPILNLYQFCRLQGRRACISAVSVRAMGFARLPSCAWQVVARIRLITTC